MAARKTNTNPSSLKNRVDAQVVKLEPLQVLLVWKAPVRPFKKRNREYFSTIGAIVLLLMIILLFLKEWFLILVIVALAFVTYVFGTIKPGEVEHKITNRGIATGGRSYRWEEMGRFWFTKKWGETLLQVETLLRFPRRLMLLLNSGDQNKVEELLSDYLLMEEPEKTWMDKTGDWLSKNIPLEKI